MFYTSLIFYVFFGTRNIRLPIFILYITHILLLLPNTGLDSKDRVGNVRGISVENVETFNRKTLDILLILDILCTVLIGARNDQKLIFFQHNQFIPILNKHSVAHSYMVSL